MDFKGVIKVKKVLHFVIRDTKNREIENPLEILNLYIKISNVRLFLRIQTYLQSITVFLLVLTMIKGSWMAEFGGGGPSRFSRSLLRSTRFLKAIC